MENVLFQVSNMKTSYKKFSVRGVEFELKSGEIMGLIGKSGSGKSTIVKTLVGIKKKDTGSIKLKVNNQDVFLEDHLGYSSQENALFEHLTLKENLFTFGKLRNLTKAEIKDRSIFLLKKFKLENAKNKKIVELSGGMKKRSDIIISLLHDPDILILDEPFSGLDFALTHFLWDQIKYISKQGKIIIISSHFLNALQENCQKLGFVEGGFFYNNNQLKEAMKKRHVSSLEALFTI